MKKGVSTIIAMVLLIVITIVAAIILKEWYMGSLQRNEMLVQQMTNQKIGQATEELKATSYNPSSPIYLYFQNTGTANIQLTNADASAKLLISAYCNGAQITNWTWYYWDGSSWIDISGGAAKNAILQPGRILRASMPSGLVTLSEYRITTVNGYNYSFVYGIGSVLLSANPPSRVANASATNGSTTNTIALVATVYDSFGNPLSGKTVTFEVTSGSPSAPTANTNAYGMAQVNVTPPGIAGDAIARAFVGLPSGANVSGYANIVYTPALQITSTIANWNTDKTKFTVTMNVRNNTLGSIGSVDPNIQIFVNPGGPTFTLFSANPNTPQTIQPGQTLPFSRTYTWSGGTSGVTYTLYTTAIAKNGTCGQANVICSPQAVSNTLTKAVP